MLVLTWILAIFGCWQEMWAEDGLCQTKDRPMEAGRPECPPSHQHVGGLEPSARATKHLCWLRVLAKVDPPYELTFVPTEAQPQPKSGHLPASSALG